MRPSVDGFDPKGFEDAEERVHRKKHMQYLLAGGKLPFEEFRRIQAAHNQKPIDRLKHDSKYRMEKAIDELFKNLDEGVGILSLSAAEKNLLMWAHYADAHQGMLIEFDPEHPFFNPADKLPHVDFDFGIFTPVIYSKVRPKVQIGVTSVLDELQMLKTKSDEWVKEEEYP
jgi:hypothetical protein